MNLRHATLGRGEHRIGDGCTFTRECRPAQVHLVHREVLEYLHLQGVDGATVRTRTTLGAELAHVVTEVPSWQLSLIRSAVGRVPAAVQVTAQITAQDIGRRLKGAAEEGRP